MFCDYGPPDISGGPFGISIVIGFCYSKTYIDIILRIRFIIKRKFISKGRMAVNCSKNMTGHLLCVVTALVWGTTFISTKILLRDFAPVEILFIRFMIGYLALLAICPKRLDIREKKDEITFALAGFCGVTLYFLFENVALTYTMASNVSVIISAAPFFTALFANWFLDGEKPRVNFFIGFIFAIGGIGIISFGGTKMHISPIGDILAVLSAVVWAAYSILTKKISAHGYNMIQATRHIFAYGLIFMVPVLFITGFKPDLSKIFEPVNLFNIVYLGIGASALCFVTWNVALRILGAVKTSVYIYAVPVITIIISALILNEKITVYSAVGTILTLAGLIISEFKRAKKTLI